MRAVAPLILVLALLTLPAAVHSQELPEATSADPASTQKVAPTEFDTYQLVLLVRPEERRELPADRVQEIQAGHLAHLGEMARLGHLVAAGPFGNQDDERYRGLALYRVGGVEEARRLAEQDPAVKAGRLEVEVMTWYTDKGAVAFPGVEKLRGEDAADEPADSR